MMHAIGSCAGMTPIDAKERSPMNTEQQQEQPINEPLDRKIGRMEMLIHRYYEADAHRNGGFGDPLRGQGRVLALLAAKPSTTQRELSYLLDMRQQSLSELLAKLEEKGFVTREKSAEDGRVTVVQLTEEGAQAAPSPEQMQMRPDALECLSDEERAQLEALTDKVCASVEEKLRQMGIDPNQRPQGPAGSHDHGPRGPRGRGDGGPRGGRDFKGPRDRGESGPRRHDFGGPRDRDNDGPRRHDFDGGRRDGDRPRGRSFDGPREHGFDGPRGRDGGRRGEGDRGGRRPFDRGDSRGGRGGGFRGDPRGDSDSYSRRYESSRDRGQGGSPRQTYEYDASEDQSRRFGHAQRDRNTEPREGRED